MATGTENIPADAKLLYSGAEIRRELTDIWRSVLADLSDMIGVPDIVLIPILNGALAMTNDSRRILTGLASGIVVHECPIRIFRTEGETLVPPTTEGLDGNAASLITGRHVVILDDLTDGGETLRLAEACVAEHSPASVTSIVILEKRTEAATATVADYACFELAYEEEEADHNWVFGYGMDLREEYRGLDAIYVIQV